ncbi:unnamed protein product, partial [Discosporangium mesarthrocarpum]
SAGDLSTLEGVGQLLSQQGDDNSSKVTNLQRSNISMANMVRRLDAAVHALSTRDLFWEAVEVKLSAHQKSVGDICLQVEETTLKRRSRLTLPKDAQTCLAGDMQRVAKLISTKADYEVIREIAKLDNPETSGFDWDERVEHLRQTFMAKFLRESREALDRKAPTIKGAASDEIRYRFIGKMRDALKIALSKYTPTTPGATLFGKIKLQ